MKTLWIIVPALLMLGCVEDDDAFIDAGIDTATDSEFVDSELNQGSDSVAESTDSLEATDEESTDSLEATDEESDSPGSSDEGQTDTGDTDRGTDTAGPDDTGDTGVDTGSDTGTVTSEGTVLYDGETVFYASGEAWDSTSSISESTADPYSAPNHIRADVITSGGWGAVVYYFYSGATEDWTEATRLSMQAKADSAVDVSFALIFVDGADYSFGSEVSLELSTSYQAFDIDVASVSQDVDPAQVAGMILYGGTGRFTVDVDDVVLFTGDIGTPDTDIPDTDIVDTDIPDSDVIDSDSVDTDLPDTDVIDTDTVDTDTTDVGPTEAVHFFGRFDRRDPQSPACAWSNCGFGVRFEGDTLDVKLSGAGAITFQVVLDGEVYGEITTDGWEWSSDPSVNTYRVAEGLTAGEHDVELYRNPEAMFGAVAFHGFEAVNGSLIESPPPFDRKIEIIGDSISAGYGNDGCPFSAATEIGASAYGPLAARQLGAVANVEAWSGKGMVMDYNGGTDEQMPYLYGYALPDDPQTGWDYADYIPDVVVVNLGTNDFNGGVNRNTYMATYEEFVIRLRGYYPDAYILCAVNSSGDAFSDEVDEIIADLGDPNVEKIELGVPNWSGCDGHPDLAAHRMMADTLAARLRAELGW